MSVSKRKSQPPNLDKIDVCVLDFDGCMYPGISKIAVARHMAVSLALHPALWQDRRHLPRLAYAAFVLLTNRLWQRATNRLSDADLVRLYARLLAPMPSNYVRQAAASVPAGLMPGVEDAFGWLASRWPVGVISLALSDVLDAVDIHLERRTGHKFAFKCGNRIGELCSDATTSPVLTQEDKRAHMAVHVERLNCVCPLVIGHDQEDLGLVDLAREMGGLSIGFNPGPRIAHHFDLTLHSRDWQGIPRLLEESLQSSSTAPEQQV